MLRFNDKERINTLLNIDNVFGEHEGHILPIIGFLLIAGAPPLAWLFFLQGTFVKWWMMLVFTVLWAARWALIILGKEKKKMEFYDKQRTDEYKSADELVHITFVHDDGLIEYQNGQVAYIISGFPKGYLTEDKLSVDFENFFLELDNWDWDMYMHNAVDELLCEENLPNLARYKDKEVISERIEFYAYQDEYARTNSGLYRYNFLVRAAKYNWKKLKAHLDELVSSQLALCFNEIRICNKEEVTDLLNRDICAFVDINKMLTAKYMNEQYHGSKVLWYDNNIPEQYIPEQDSSDIEERRIQ